jgi:cell division protein ZipA
MNLRDWLIIIGAVIIVGILVDGFRRMRLANRDSLKMSRDMGGDIENSPVDDDYNPELPTGGARIISDQAIDTGVVNVSNNADVKVEPHLDVEVQVEVQENIIEPASSDDDIESTDSIVADPSSRIELESVEVKTAHAGRVRKVAEIETTSEQAQALVVVINVHASTNKGFSGTDIKQLLEACGLDHGDMSIFHRHEEDDLLSPIQFSVANAIEPGYFDPDTLETISTPGVSFFMTLPGPKDYSKAFEYMLETAQCFARNLKGELKDEQLSIMTSQTIEHSRSKIKEFERLQLSKTRV